MNVWVEHWNALSAAWGAHLWRGTWQGGAALLAVWVVCRLMPKLPPGLRYGLWCLAFLKLLVATMPLGAVDLPLLHAPEVRAGDEAFVPSSRLVDTAAAAAAADRTMPGAPAATASVIVRPTLTAIAVAVWSVGVVVMALRLTWHQLAAARLRRSAPTIEDPLLLATLVELCGRMGVRRRVAILAADDIDSPLLVGVARPAIVLPWRVAALGNGARVRLMIAHELAHLRHGDLLLNLLPAICRALFFFHPPVWLAEREWQQAQESACDRAAVAATGCGVGEYGEMLLDVASSVTAAAAAGGRIVRRRGSGGAVIAVLDSRRTLERRLRAMRHFSDWSTRRGSRWMAVAVALVAVAALVPWRVVAQQQPAGNAQSSSSSSPVGTASAAAAAADDKGNVTAPAAGGGTTAAVAGAAKPGGGDVIEVLGTLTAGAARVTCPTDTVVRVVNLKEGARVKRGDLLFQLDDRRARDGLVEAEVQIRSAEARVKRVKSMRDAAAISQAEIEDAEAGIEMARATLDRRRHDMEDTRIVAPFDAIVERLDVRPGQGVSKNTVLCELMEAGTPTLVVEVPSSHYPRLRVGGRVEATTDILPGRTYTGELTFVAPRIDPATGTIQAKAAISDPKDELKAGMTMRVRVTLGE